MVRLRDFTDINVTIEIGHNINHEGEIHAPWGIRIPYELLLHRRRNCKDQRSLERAFIALRAFWSADHWFDLAAKEGLGLEENVIFHGEHSAVERVIDGGAAR